ncbi:MAG: hypothetical protein U0V74_15260 [Chitinophagales bacterium]
MLFKRALCVLFTFLILLADSGQTLYAHTCVKKDKTAIGIVVTISNTGSNIGGNSCCAKKQLQAQGHCSVSRPHCCIVKSAFIKHFFPLRFTAEKKFTLNPASVTPVSPKINLPVNAAVTYKGTHINPPPRLLSQAQFTGVFRI